MKIFKAVAPYSLEQATRDGWALEQTLPTSRYEKVQCDTPLALYPKRDDNYNSMQHTNLHRDELVQVNEPVFILSKDLDMISREETLVKNLQEANDKLKLADQRNVSDTRDIKDLTAKNESAGTRLAETQSTLTNEQTARRKLELDLGKIRAAIGTVRYDEILAP